MPFCVVGWPIKNTTRNSPPLRVNSAPSGSYGGINLPRETVPWLTRTALDFSEKWAENLDGLISRTTLSHKSFVATTSQKFCRRLLTTFTSDQNILERVES